MKRLIACLLACALLCSCTGKNDYGKAYEAAKVKKTFTATVKNEMTVESEGQTTPYSETVRYAQGNGIQSAKVNGEQGYAEYYYKDGCIYHVSDAGKYVWEAEPEEFYGSYCYEKPLEHTFDKSEKKDGEVIYTVSLNGNDYAEKLLAINPAVSDFGITESEFTRFVYTAAVKDGELRSYTYDFTLNAVAGGQTAVINNVMTVTFEEQADDVTMPSDHESFLSSGGNIADISEEAFSQEVMLIIVEALYNADGTRKDDFDQTYAEFVSMYGEETMSTFIAGIEEFNASIGVTN